MQKQNFLWLCLVMVALKILLHLFIHCRKILADIGDVQYKLRYEMENIHISPLKVKPKHWMG